MWDRTIKMKKDKKLITKVAIITVCYNAADIIEETMKSVLAQTYV